MTVSATDNGIVFLAQQYIDAIEIISPEEIRKRIHQANGKIESELFAEDEEHYLSTKELTEKLEDEYGMTCERRTIYANINLLKEYGHKISTWQENGFGYYLIEHQFLPEEVEGICKAIKNASSFSTRQNKTLLQKLLSTFSDYQQSEIKKNLKKQNG